MTNTIYSTKKCSKCKKDKSLSDFNKKKSNRDGFQYQCKQCQKQWRSNNKEKISKCKKRWQLDNKDRIKEYEREYRLEHKEKIAEYYKDNKEKIKQYQIDNKDKKKLYDKQYRLDNKEKIAEYYKDNKDYLNNCKKQKYHNNLEYRLHCCVSSTLRNTIIKKYKTSKYLEKFGYTIEQLKTHLELKFSDGMTWENHGLYGWHIDHIKPKSWFDCSDEKQLIECWSLSNLQPLWAKENMSKGNRYIG